MFFDTGNSTGLDCDVASSGGAAPALPHALAATERAAAALRAFLQDNGLHEYRISHCRDLDLHDLEQYLAELDDRGTWHPAPPLVVGGQSVASVVHKSAAAVLRPVGFLRLPRFQVVLARWFWVNPEIDARPSELWLGASASPEAFATLRTELFRLRRETGGRPVWRTVQGHARYDDASRPRVLDNADALILSEPLRQRMTLDVLRFFSDEVAALYRTLGVPYRRGVLMHGPPGNGKTSLVRWIGASLPQIPAMILRPSASFDSDDLQEVIRRWQRQAPCILVIEDLDWLIKEVNVSTFLNLIDGIDSTASGGLLLIATTNHPEKLDPAINNRPGRFDVVVEVPCPDATLREQFLRRKLPALGEDALREVVRMSEGFAFAHLHEVLHRSGLSAIAAGRSERNDADVIRAARDVAAAREDAQNGFPPKMDVGFGLGALRAIRKERVERGR